MIQDLSKSGKMLLNFVSMRSTYKLGFVSISIPIILFLVFTIHVTLAADYVPAEKIFLSCRGTDNTDSNGRKWTTDIGSKYLSANAKSTTSSAATQDPSVPTVPYMTARVFPSNFTYSIPVVAGRKFVRLYFYAASYAGLNASDGVFSVKAGPYTLLNNFSAAQTTEALNFAFLVKSIQSMLRVQHWIQVSSHLPKLQRRMHL